MFPAGRDPEQSRMPPEEAHDLPHALIEVGQPHVLIAGHAFQRGDPEGPASVPHPCPVHLDQGQHGSNPTKVPFFPQS